MKMLNILRIALAATLLALAAVSAVDRASAGFFDPGYINDPINFLDGDGL
jgi:hypothetical protein